MTNLLLATSNGTGMGHLTRQAAVAKALGPSDHATLFSLSLGLPLVTGLGIAGEYCPSHDRPWIASRDWHAYLRDRLIAIVRETESEAVVFDGVAPYPGIGMASAELRDVAFIWLRRGMWQPGTGKQHLRKSRYFDLIIEPGDLAAASDRGPTARRRDAERVGPISILETIDLMPRDDARSELGLPTEGNIALITLGSGRLGDVAGPGHVAVESLLALRPKWHIAVTRSPVALNEIPLDEARRITELEGVFPLASYLSAFDIAVSSAGYNAAHELIPAGIPTLMVANTSTRRDDQVARAKGLQAEGLSLAAQDDDLELIKSQLNTLANKATRSLIAESAAQTMGQLIGASDTATLSSDFAIQFKKRNRNPTYVLSAGWQRAKDLAKGALGEERTTQLKKVLGRYPSESHQRTSVKVGDAVKVAENSDVVNLAMVNRVSSKQLRLEMPVEHVLPGSSSGYWNGRRQIVDEYYDVVG